MLSNRISNQLRLIRPTARLLSLGTDRVQKSHPNARSIFISSQRFPPSSISESPSYLFRRAASSSHNPWKMSVDIDYQDLKPITQMPSDDVLIVDVREEGEVIQGNIPSSVNIPMSSFEKLMELHPDDFLKTLGFPKPSLDQKIIFYCRSGARSAKAVEIAKLKGFKNLRNYKGSWLDWISKENSS